jgi:pilus assembly protein Flp/PilA
MRRFITSAKKFVKAQAGATMAEYGLLLALIAVVVMAAAIVLGTKISSVFNGVATAI